MRGRALKARARSAPCHHERLMRRAAVVLLGAILALAAVATVLRPDWGRNARPPASGPSVETPGSAPLPPTVAPPAGRPDAPGSTAPAALERARDVLAAVQARGGEPPAGYVGGRAFHNRERRLPAGQYREYDLRPRVAGRDRGPERLVIDQVTGRAYYTGDHYRTFVPLN
jgi:guanyl-specific ribonuclease Sa